MGVDTVAKGPAADAASTVEAEAKPATSMSWEEGLRRVPDKMPTIALLILVVEVRTILNGDPKS